MTFIFAKLPDWPGTWPISQQPHGHDAWAHVKEDRHPHQAHSSSDGPKAAGRFY